jgi:hypothetical protein
MKSFQYAGAVALLLVAAAGARSQGWTGKTLIVTASNTPSNSLLVYDTSDRLLQTVSTGGAGGASGNSGGIAASWGWTAAVNFGSQSVSIFKRSDSGLELKQIIAINSSPVSVAFGHGHLYVLGTTTVESHPIFEFGVSPSADGVAALVLGDGSAAQVGVLENQLILTEKSNAIETVDLKWDGAVTGLTSLVQNIPANVNAPFGLVTRDNDAYVTIAHANEISLVRNDDVLTITGSGTQNAPCWLALDGPFLFSSNSPSMTVSRYLVYGQTITQQVAVSASFNGDPTDISYNDGLLAVVDGSGAISHLSVFHVDGNGNLNLKAVTTIQSAINGVVILDDGE